MRSVFKYGLILFIIIAVSAFLFGAEEKAKPKAEAAPAQGSSAPREGGGNMSLGGVKGPGTEPALFNDDSLVYTPVPTFTPIYTIKTPDKEAWAKLTDTKAYIDRGKKDVIRYEKFMRVEFMKNLNSMGSVVSSMHTQALLDRRDQVEQAWGQSVEKTIHTLALCEEWNNEFKEEYTIMEKNQSRVKALLKKFRKKIQQPWQVETKLEQNKEEMYFLKKNTDHYGEIFNEYTDKYNKMLRTKEDKVNKLLNDHYELYKP